MPEILAIAEASTIFADITGEAWEAFKDDVRANGVQMPVVVNRDGEVVDGKNRQRAVVELNDAGETLNGRPYELPRVRQDGGRAEQIAYSMMVNLNRRQLSSGQRAASAVEGTERMLKLLKEEAREAGTPFVNPVEGDKAEWIARRAGTNRQYVYNAMSIRKADRRLFDQVIRGEVKITAALKQIEQPEAGNGDGRAEEPAQEERPPEPVLDGLGQPVDAGSPHVQAFAARPAYRDAAQQLYHIQSVVAELAAGPAGKWLDAEAVLAGLKAARSSLRKAEPWAVCAGCDGRPGNGCEVCGRKGYLSKGEYSLLERAGTEAASAAS